MSGILAFLLPVFLVAIIMAMVLGVLAVIGAIWLLLARMLSEW
jgi:hypothetical protein